MVDGEWYHDFFSGPAVDFWIRAIPEEHTEGEVDLAVSELACLPPARLLDIPCGAGRHALRLAARGFQVTGVDLSDDFLEVARAGARGLAEKPDFVRADMREFQGQGEFDGAYCLGNSFGYFAFDGMLQFLQSVASALKPGGRFLVDASVAAECLLPSFEEREWYEAGDLTMLMSNSYHPEESAFETEYTFIRHGGVVRRTAYHHVYTCAEIERMMLASGFETLELLGSPHGEVFKLGSPQLYIVAKRI